MNLLFVRHAESLNNRLLDEIRDRLGVDVPDHVLLSEEARLRVPDCGLSSTGTCQANKLGEYAARGGFSDIFEVSNNNFTVFCSPMQRCLLTCQQLQQGLGGCPVKVNEQLYELFGCYNELTDGSSIGLCGATGADIESRFSNFTCSESMTNGWYDCPAKETREHFHQRVADIAAWIRGLYHKRKTDSSLDTVIIVAHGHTLGRLTTELMGCSDAFCHGIHYNTGVTHLQLFSVADNPHPVVAVQFFNSSAHLTSLPDDNDRDDKYITQPHVHSVNTLLTGHYTKEDNWIQELLGRELQ